MTKFLILIYGIVCYLLALATVLYTAGFEENLLVPKGIDGGTSEPLLVAIAINVVVLTIFVLQHTLMARPAFKAQWTRVIPEAAERSTFVLAATAVFALFLWQWRPIAGVVWNVEDPLWGPTLMALNFFGWAIFLWSTFLIDHFDLFGVKQVWRNFRGITPPAPDFCTPALYKMCRHPMMLGFIIAFWATPLMTIGHLFFAFAVTVFFTTKSTGEGTGLGLSISHDIVVQQHAGELAVESEPGAFTRFCITLPRSCAAADKP